ncbi:MAG: hypothetical protein K2P92_01010 [Bdellovibrionaceae bacterium]|nr:hypothetical protein [Pseudobdellovibrionaceae bacterium]
MTENHIAIEVSQDEHYVSPYLKSLKENWPSLARDYRHYCHTVSPKTGELWTWTSPEGQKFFHLVLDAKSDHSVSENMAHAQRLQSFKRALKELKKVAEAEKIKAIELPKIGFHFSDHEFSLALMMLKETFLDTETEIKFV